MSLSTQLIRHAFWLLKFNFPIKIGIKKIKQKRVWEHFGNKTDFIGNYMGNNCCHNEWETLKGQIYKLPK